MKTLKAIYNHFESIKELLVVLFVFSIISLCFWSVVFPRNAKAGECACYTFPPFEKANCFDTETQKECNL